MKAQRSLGRMVSDPTTVAAEMNSGVGSGPYDGGRWNEFWSVDVILEFFCWGTTPRR